jgi:hypothetical protein
MTIRTVANQYVGINAHLHSYFQSQGGWDSSHTNHIADLMRLMRAQLLQMGYIADIEQSLQIRRAEEELSPYRAVAIYEYIVGDPLRGEPVAWIELLSPSNKPGGQDASYYRDKRLKLLQSGVVFVELDYLHESSPTFEGFPSYRIVDNLMHAPIILSSLIRVLTGLKVRFILTILMWMTPFPG